MRQVRAFFALIRLARILIGSLSVVFSIGACAGSGISESIDAIRRDAKLPALGGIAIQDGTVSAFAVTGARKQGDATAAEPTDKWHIGSCTKAMTATLVATLIEDGQLRWDSTLGELLSDWPDLHADYRNVTVEMLLAHRGGTIGEREGDLPAFGDGSLWRSLWDPDLDPSVGRKRLREAVLAAAPAHLPGSIYDYSNAGYTIVGSLLEKITGKSWETLMSEIVFAPLHMLSCGFGAAGDPAAARPDQPWGHSANGDMLEPVAPDFFADNPPTLGPSATVHCSLLDWSRFASLHLDGFVGKTTPILTSESFTKLHTAYPGQQYTYGGWIREERDWARGPTLSHGGSNGRNYAVIWLAPKRNLGMLAVTNAGTEGAAVATDQVIDLFLDTVERHTERPTGTDER